MTDVTILGPKNGVAKNVVDSSSNVQATLLIIIGYLQSVYDLQAADTQLEASITNAETKLVQQFQAQLNSNSGPGNYLHQLETLDPKDPQYDNKVRKVTMEYSAANAQNQSMVKVMDGNNSTAQNVLSQNAQAPQGVLQTMGSINGLASNLARLLQG